MPGRGWTAVRYLAFDPQIGVVGLDMLADVCDQGLDAPDPAFCPNPGGQNAFAFRVGMGPGSGGSGGLGPGGTGGGGVGPGGVSPAGG